MWVILMSSLLLTACWVGVVRGSSQPASTQAIN